MFLNEVIMVKVYGITHRYNPKNIDSEILIGFFTSLKKCKLVLQHYRTLEGFKDYKNCFKIKHYWVSNIAIQQKYIYKVDYFTDETNTPNCSNAIYLDLGVYAKYKNATRTTTWSSKILPRVFKVGEVICEKYLLNSCNWTEGFILD